jgi:uncharacterized SAM-binding protein YcdF (DUF218 family)
MGGVMLDYALEQLMDGISLPGLLLILLPISLLLTWVTSQRRYLYLVVVFLIGLSLPVTGKLLFAPIDIGIKYPLAEARLSAGDADAIVVIAGGGQIDHFTGKRFPTAGSFAKLKKAELLAEKLNLPLVVSASDGADKGEMPYLLDQLDRQLEMFLSYDSETTLDHAANIAGIMKAKDFTKAIVFVSGNHAYRTKAVLEKLDVEVIAVVVGINDSDLSWRAFIPRFEGFFYWKHALKEYAGLIYYKWEGHI